MTATPSPANRAPEATIPAPRASVARERVHAMESLAAVIAHELRAGVLGVTSAAQLLRYSVPQDPVAEKSLGRILQEADRLSALHEALTEYATELPPRLSVADPDALWREIARGMRGALEANSVTLVHTSGSPPPQVRLDADQLGRAFERGLYHALGRVQPGAELKVTSSVDADWWICSISAREPASIVRPESERPTFMLMLAQRAAIAHGGDVIDHRADEAPLIVTFRLPLPRHAE